MIKKIFTELDFIPASHENEKKPGVWKKVLFTWEELPKDRRVQMINWAKLPSGKSFQKHFHQDMDEVFIMIEGQVEITINSEKEILQKGDSVFVPQRGIHTMRNRTKTDVHYIVVGLSQGKGGQTIDV